MSDTNPDAQEPRPTCRQMATMAMGAAAGGLIGLAILMPLLPAPQWSGRGEEAETPTAESLQAAQRVELVAAGSLALAALGGMGAWTWCRRRQRNLDDVPGGRQEQCPECGRGYEAPARLCPHCGCDLGADPSRPHGWSGARH